MKTQSEPIVYYSGKSIKEDQEIVLSHDENIHLTKVKRINPPCDVFILNEQKLKVKGVFLELDKKNRAIIKINEISSCNPTFKLAAALPLIKMNRIEIAIEKLTEIGVNHFYFYKADFSNLGSVDFRKKDLRWKNIIISACKQSRNFLIPDLFFFNQLHDIFKSTEISNIFVPIELNQNETIFDFFDLIKKESNAFFVIGLEGGFSCSEIEILDLYKSNFFKISSYILRTETAAIYTAAMINEMINFKKGMSL